MRDSKINIANFLGYDPGALPTLPPFNEGEFIEFEVKGEPPIKTLHQSIRNPSHPMHENFKILRIVAAEAMGDRLWYQGAIEIDFTLHSPKKPRYKLLDYAAGISDTLDGSHGFAFTYLPIVYEDDCQIYKSAYKYIESEEEKYTLRIRFSEKSL